ncbi:acyltransferase family protein [Hymenobacter convexus]|uniref:acyltransferase family protein n=1 Tax=Hymenobacter sp. CA1UV-4 TaxID=3063782 RepID=UPI002713E131|nr:acyltransferase [Hymenobacter sp. CA1UV-4]MDO7852005.1 acyltransferase [Hymenobacter sp. CA1UV-4]
MPQHLEKVNVLRGAAIMLVFGYHSLLVVFGQYEIYDFSPSGLWIDFARYAPGRIVLGLTPPGLGAQGVTLFLVISGFLIHWGFLKSGATFRPGEFFSKRFWRIYPPYLVAVAVFGLTLGTGGQWSLLTHLTLTHNLFERTFFTINPSFWSLALEAQLYVLYPVFLLLRRWLGGVGKATLAVAALAGLAMALEIGGQTRSPTLWLSVLNLWIVWALGAYFGEQFFQGRRVFRRGSAHLAGAYGLLTLSALTPVYALLGRALFSLFFICLMDWYLHRPASAASAVGQVLTGLVARVGLYSYSIYLFHQPFLADIIQFLSFGQQSKPVLGLAVAASFALLFAIAHFTYHWLELPAIHWGKALDARWQRPGPAAAVSKT